jgi:hypothetical protein
MIPAPSRGQKTPLSFLQYQLAATDESQPTMEWVVTMAELHGHDRDHDHMRNMKSGREDKFQEGMLKR